MCWCQEISYKCSQCIDDDVKNTLSIADVLFSKEIEKTLNNSDVKMYSRLINYMEKNRPAQYNRWSKS